MKIIVYFFLALISFCVQGQVSSSMDQPSMTASAFFSQDLYVPGDTAFFRVVLLPDRPAPWHGSPLLHVDLINNNGSIVFKQNFRLEGGSGGNQLIIPYPLEAGAYVFSLRLNGDSGVAMTKMIMIAGKKNGTIDGERTHATLTARQPPRQEQPLAIEMSGVNPEYMGRQKVEVTMNVHLGNESLIKSAIAVRVVNLKIVRSDSAKKQTEGRSKPSDSAHDLSLRNSSDLKPKLSNTIVWEGKVLNKNSNAPVPDSTHVAVFLQKNKIGYDFYTGKGGHFKVTTTSDFYEDDKVFVLASYHGKELPVDWLLDPEESPTVHAPVVQYSEHIDWYSDFSEHKREVDRAFYFFRRNPPALREKNSLEDGMEDEFQSADITVTMKDYLIFPTMEEIVNEIIPSLSLKRKDQEVILKMNLLISLDNPVASKATPLLIIDGVMTKDLNAFLSLRPSELVSIKLIRKMNKLLPWGLLGKDGIVFVTTRNTTIAKELVANYPDVKGLTEAMPFISKNYSLPGDPLIPDFRTLLYWNPALPVDAAGHATFSFYTSDSLGEFVIQVEGESSKGEMLRGDQPFKVSLKARSE